MSCWASVQWRQIKDEKKYSLYHSTASVLLGMCIVIKAICGTMQQVQGCKNMVSCDL